MQRCLRGKNDCCLNFSSCADGSILRCRLRLFLEARKRTTGSMVKKNKVPILSTTTKQKILAQSSEKAEYVRLFYCGEAVKCLRILFLAMQNEIIVGDEPPNMYLISVFSGIFTLSSVVQNVQTLERNKHNALKFHFFKELVTNGILRME